MGDFRCEMVEIDDSPLYKVWLKGVLIHGLFTRSEVIKMANLAAKKEFDDIQELINKIKGIHYSEDKEKKRLDQEQSTTEIEDSAAPLTTEPTYKPN